MVTPAVAAERRPIALHRMRVVPGGRPPEVQEYPPQVATEVLLAGRVRGKRRTGPLRHLPGGWSDSTLPVNVVLVDHPGGLCLFDAGPGPIGSPDGLPWHPWLRLARFEPVEPDALTAALERRGATRDDIRWVVLSHLHVDHVGGLAGVPAAEVIVSRMEWARAQGLRGRVRGYVPDLWPDGRDPVLVEPKLPAVGPVPGPPRRRRGRRAARRADARAHAGTRLAPRAARRAPGAVRRRPRVRHCEELAAVRPDIADWCAREEVDYVGAHGPTDAAARR